MADNILLNSGSGGVVMSTDEILGINHQRAKLVQGVNGINDGDVSSSSPLHATMANAVLTAAVHVITATINSSGLSDGLTALTPKFAAINTVNGNNTVVAAVSGKKIRVLAALIVGAVTAQKQFIFQDGTNGTFLTGSMYLGDNSSTSNTTDGIFVWDYSPVGHFETSAGNLLDLESFGAEIRGCLTYVEV